MSEHFDETKPSTTPLLHAEDGEGVMVYTEGTVAGVGEALKLVGDLGPFQYVKMLQYVCILLFGNFN